MVSKMVFDSQCRLIQYSYTYSFDLLLFITFEDLSPPTLDPGKHSFVEQLQSYLFLSFSATEVELDLASSRF